MKKRERVMTKGDLRRLLEEVKTAWPDVVELKAWWELVEVLKPGGAEEPLSKKAESSAKRLAKLIMRWGAIPPPACGPCFMLNHALGLKYIRPPIPGPC